MRIRLIIVLAISSILACSKSSVYINKDYKEDKSIAAESPILQQVYLIGDVGASIEESESSLQLLKKELSVSDPEITSVVFLGDNIYPRGLHPKDHPLRAEDEKRLNAQLDVVKDFKGEIVFIPGNHDWQQGGEDGFAFNKRQEKYVQSYLNNKAYKPSDGCSDPKEIEISDELVLILIDTQWWLHKHEKGRGEKDDCIASTKEDFVLAFKEVLKRNRDKNIIVAGHHPMYSNGVHGGYFSWKDHLFPLTKINSAYKIPLPIVGTIYPFYRSYFGNIQDIANPTYQELQKVLTDAMGQYDNIIYACGHEHNLQYHFKKSTHYIVSGSGSKVSKLKYNNHMNFGAEHKGFAKVEIREDGGVYAKYYASDKAPSENPILLERKLYTKNIKGFKELSKLKLPSYKGMYKTVVPDSNYEASGLKKVFFGDLNRDLWTTPIKVPVLDIHYVYGGLQPIEKGGGQQTVSLKLMGGDGKKYKLRGIKKNAQFLVQKELRGTIAQDMVYDGIAGSHPYASVIVPKLLEAGQLYFSNPKLVYIPKDSILGDFMDEFGGMFALLEVHPNKNMSDMSNFGNSKKIVNTEEAIKKMQKHQDHVVDVDFAVRNRLLDMLLGDWDRHDDQWRWATFKEDGKTLYRPIPRDRDQVFFKFDGVVMSIANRKWLIRKFQPFAEDVRDIAGLNFNARYFDRSFLVEADKDLWMKQAKLLQSLITDEAIEEAIHELPKESIAINGKDLIETLKLRREKLTDFAERYYKILSKTVDVVGTTEKDYFEVIRLEGGKVEVNIYLREDGKKVKEKRFYHRVFYKEETKEIRLYGLSNKDEYKIKGEVKNSVLVRIIAGDKKDKIEDKSMVKGILHKTKIYDVEGKQEAELSKESRLKVYKEGKALFYDRKAFAYDNVIPLPSIGYNLDDGFILGPGFTYVKHGFNKKPFEQKHELLANYTFRAEGVNARYRANYIELIGTKDLDLDFTINQPKVYQFYGLGNEVNPTEEELGNSQLRMQNYQFQTKLAKTSEDLSRKFSGGVELQFIELEEAAFGDLSTLDVTQEFLSFSLDYDYNHVDHLLNPNKGLRFHASAKKTLSMNNDEIDFYQLKTKLSFYFPLNVFKKQSTLAMRLGYAGNSGDFAFYQANFLSGVTELRGLPRNRYAGESVGYGNLELRKSFIKNKDVLALFDFGVLTHGDVGRVWVDGENSKLWHHSYGGGVYMNILEFFALVATYSVSDQDELVNVGTNFYF